MNKKIPRIFFEKKIKINNEYLILNEMYHYCVNVLRIKLYEIIEIFNNTNTIYYGSVIKIFNKKMLIKILSKKNIKYPKKIYIHLIQVIYNYEIMKFIIQKATELGVNEITPIISNKSNIKITSKYHISKKIKQWKQVAITACIQCKRNILPKINQITSMEKYVQISNNTKNKTKIIFHPNSQIQLHEIKKKYKNIELLIGPKSGFTLQEIEYAIKNNFINISLGEKILKSETASITAIALFQLKYKNL
ncbi:16S rRNA (uracil(1498)-N(3))-methyltransferase [Buchnera aphidicola]|uniref:16S rRNA (uracil(1498)-N(3))-methyltransferase n=1 Tax=Buchnera aphidicola TaxID=9 RepID=UPI003464CCA8